MYKFSFDFDGGCGCSRDVEGRGFDERGDCQPVLSRKADNDATIVEKEGFVF
jgi:hypothetical protein